MKGRGDIDGLSYTPTNTNVMESSKTSWKSDNPIIKNGSKSGSKYQLEESKVKVDQSKTKHTSLLQLYRYCTWFDIFLIVVGTLAAIITGMATPINFLAYRNLIELFLDTARQSYVNATSSNLTVTPTVNLASSVSTLILYFCIIAVVCFCSAYTSMVCWSITAERQTGRIRKEYFRAILRQEIGWYDTHETGELNSRLASDLHLIADCLGDKVSVLLQYLSAGVSSYIIAVVLYWKLAFVALAFSPIIITMSVLSSKRLKKMFAAESRLYAAAGAVAEEALHNIKTVQAFQGQDRASSRYESQLKKLDRIATKKGLNVGIVISAFWFFIFIMCAVTFWYGVKLFQEENVGLGSILPILICVMVGSTSLGHSLPYLETMAKGQGAAENIFKIIDSKPTIDVSSDKGDKPAVQGNIEFKTVDFSYPARPDVKVLSNFNLKVRKQQTVALVGSSGSGKSTVVQLIQRFFDVASGQVLIDGNDVKSFNVKYLRQQIGVVSQEPVLFSTTIAENIRYGSLDVTDEEVIKAAQTANAHNFIKSLPQGYETLVGQRGAHLSGGQKQRIAIARALVRNPKILLLDEATSALDHENEAIVQEALEKVEAGRTIIIVAHRLSTIQNADWIVVVDQGEIVEQGTHNSLMARGDKYSQLVKTQMDASKSVSDNEEETDDVKTGLHHRNYSNKSNGSIKQIEAKDEEKVVEDEIPSASFRRLLKLNSPEWKYMVAGIIASVFSGLYTPFFAFTISEFIRIFTFLDPVEQMDSTVIMSAIVAGFAVFTFIINIIRSILLTLCGDRLTSRIRRTVFKSLLKQDMEFFDDPKNQVGMLTTKLSSDSTVLQGATGSKIGGIIQNVVTLGTCLVLAFYYSWKLSLVLISFVPVLVLSGHLSGKKAIGMNSAEGKILEQAGGICSEAVDNIRTVASITREDIFIKRYEHLIDQVERNGRKKAFVSGIFIAISQCMIYFTYAANFAFGAYLVDMGELEVFAVFRVFASVAAGSMIMGRQNANTMDYSKAIKAGGRLFQIIDRVPKIDTTDNSGLKPEKFSGEMEVSDVEFSYPSRSQSKVLTGFNLTVRPGQTVALVGHSGCGKSTIIKLIQRFYDTTQGKITFEEADIRSTNISWLRSQIGIVSQEPSLFDMSIAENIAYGDNLRDVPMSEIISAARSANIHNFIVSLPEGYDTNVGDKGTQLSGGQKQRIAIARALIRNPKVLLLDEATSALDSQSEQVVQEALDTARQGRTCIVIAHRLSTIQSADLIIVVQDGRLEESGTHAQLLELRGAYYRLHQAQSRTRKESVVGLEP